MHPRWVGKSRSFAGPCFDGTTNGSSEPGQPGFTDRIKQMGFTAAITATEPFDRFSFIQFCDRVRPAMLKTSRRIAVPNGNRDCELPEIVNMPMSGFLLATMSGHAG